ncbi:ATP-dependent RNA helicase DeaD [Clostridium acetireducens DSM 10703]|uniref:ATP-dependent RNA helicase DeaD n=1 Tax=Clostridium acetireducens DSM 10703 TaxID=1121290 RepID=A0A1E8EZR4_9CLOT|nr:DEAD/DEAH box helicase [Clostridium acetireducens]OFI06664.1 ATP-dependent RNA helicase DeaD [Clostridium acetireducens DSM 10703]
MNIDKVLYFFDKYEKDDTIQNFIAQANSRYILYNVNEIRENFPNYTKGLDEKCTNIAVNYLMYGYSFFIHNMKDEAAYSLEKAASVLEHIYCFNGCENSYRIYFRIVCALAYYTSSQYSKAFIILKKFDFDTLIAKLIKLFLIKDLSKLQILLDEIQFNQNIQGDNTNFEDKIYIKILSLYFINIIQFIYSGNQKSLEKAKEIICDLIELSSINQEPHLWWIFRLLSLINSQYNYTSLWRTILPLIDDGNNKRVKDYILINIYKQKPIIELFKSQLNCLEQISSKKGAVISIPTSSGKTKIAEIAILKSLIENENSKCLYIAPFRSLAYEVEISLSSILEIIGYNVSHLYGSTQYTQIDRTLVEYSDVIIATPEKAKAIIRSTDEIINQLKLVVIDEGHLVGMQDRYIISELFIEELKATLKINGGKMVLLSAVLPNLTDFAKWITGDEKLIASSNWRPSSQRLGVLDFYKNTVNVKWFGIVESFNKSFIEPRLVKPERITKTGKRYKAVYLPSNKKEAVAATAVKLLSLGSVLIYVGRSNMVLSQARIVSKVMQDFKITHEWNNQNDYELFKLVCEEAYGMNSELLKFVSQGIICHSSKLPTDVRLSIEKLMRNGTPKIIIATSTLAQGVNIGISTVIISNIYLDKDKVVDVKDFWNIAGRAGRAFVDTEGKILYAINRNQENWSIYKQYKEMKNYYKQSNIEKAVSGVYLLLKGIYKVSIECGIDYNNLLELIAENQIIVSKQDNIAKFCDFMRNKFDLIDDTLLSLNIKYNSFALDDSSSWIDDCFRGSLAYIESINKRDFDEIKIIEILKARNKGVLKIAGNPLKWAHLVSSSVPLRVSISISNMTNDIISKVNNFINSNQDINSLLKIVKYLDKIICSLPTKNINDFIVEEIDIENIRRLWFSGSPIILINKTNKYAQKIYDEYYGFQFPWITNSLAKRVRKLGYEDEGKVIENISLLAELGLPNINCAKIYLSGIRTRETSVEISNKLDLDNDLSLRSVKNKLLYISENVTSVGIDFSNKGEKWLNVLNLDNKYKIKKHIKGFRFKFFRGELLGVNKLLIKKINKKYYVSTFDYKIKCEVYLHKEELFDSIANIKGIWLERISEEKWLLKSNNPYIILE